MTPSDLVARLVELDGPANFRDLGGYPTLDGRRVRTGRVYRSDSLSYLSEADVRHLIDRVGLRSVVDLRGLREVETFTHGPLGSLDVSISHIPIIDEPRREPDGRAPEMPAGIDALYLLMLERFGHTFVEVLRVVADGDTQPLVFHCAAGKDRTGLVAMLVLALLGVDPEVIAADYALSGERMAILLARHRARGVDGSPIEVAAQRYQIDEAAMLAVIAHLTEEHGSVEGYVRAHGLEPTAIAALRATLLE